MASLQLDNNTNDTSNGATIINIDPNELLAGNATAGAEPDSGASGSGLARSLVSVGFLTLLMDTGVALHKPPGGAVFGRHWLAYYLTLAGVFAAGLAELWAAFSVSRCGSGCRVVLARAVLYASVVPLVVVIDLGGFSVLVKI